MDKRRARKTARHEAGHLVMNWYLGCPATRTEIFDEEAGLCSGSGEEVRCDTAKFQSVSGCAAEFRSNPGIFERIMRDYNCEYGESDEEYESDTDCLWHLWERFGIYSSRMIYNFCITAFYEARAILQHYRGHVDEATVLLLKNDVITEKEAAALFSKWGRPVTVFADQSKIRKRLPDISDDLAKMCQR